MLPGAAYVPFPPVDQVPVRVVGVTTAITDAVVLEQVVVALVERFAVAAGLIEKVTAVLGPGQPLAGTHDA